VHALIIRPSLNKLNNYFKLFSNPAKRACFTWNVGTQYEQKLAFGSKRTNVKVVSNALV
jgi:hypothetical protein